MFLNFHQLLMVMLTYVSSNFSPLIMISLGYIPRCYIVDPKKNKKVTYLFVITSKTLSLILSNTLKLSKL